MPDMARAVFGGPTAPANLIAVHPIRPYLPGERHEIARLRSLVDRYDPRDLIVAGDLNLTPWSFELRRLDRNLGLQRRDKAVPTWPARLFGVAWPLPFLPLDHVYAGSMWRTIDVRRGPYLGATHYPLVVDLQRIGGS